MMYCFIAVCVVTVTLQNVFKKNFSQNQVQGDFTYSGIITLFALLFFICTSGEVSLCAEYVPYSLGFAAVYLGTTIAGILALRWGSLAITSLMLSYSLVIPTLYGFLTGEKATATQLIGLGLLLVSTWLVQEKNKEQERKATFKWVIALAIAFVCNGLCSVIQTAQQRIFHGIYNTEFMIVALLVASLISLLVGLATERRQWKQILQKGLVSGALCGISNGATNFLVMIIVETVAASVFFPVLSGAQLVLLFLISAAVYHEKFCSRQVLGLALGIVSLILLNL